jgi:hypothetical protein
LNFFADKDEYFLLLCIVNKFIKKDRSDSL